MDRSQNVQSGWAEFSIDDSLKTFSWGFMRLPKITLPRVSHPETVVQYHNFWNNASASILPAIHHVRFSWTKRSEDENTFSVLTQSKRITCLVKLLNLLTELDGQDRNSKTDIFISRKRTRF